MKFKLILSILSLLLSINESFATMVYFELVEIEEKDHLVFASGNGTTSRLFSDIANQDGSSSYSSPHKLYIPINDVLAASEPRLYSAASSPSTLLEKSGTTYSGNLTFEITIASTDSSDKYLYAAYSTGSSTDFKVVNLTNSSLSSSNSTGTINYTKSLSFPALCTLDGTICDVNNSVKDINMMFFVSADELIADNSSINYDDNKAQAVFVTFSLSSKVNDTTPVLHDLRKGDERLIADFSTSLAITSVYGTAIYRDNSGVAGACSALVSSGKTVNDPTLGFDQFKIENSYTENGDIHINDLTNSQFYCFALAIIDKYQFATKLTNSLDEKPESIETFLKEQSCYLLSAGFQEEHFVIDYFKMVRDKYLLNNFFGKLFVKSYYYTAPKFTHLIYSSKVLSFGMRVMGFSLYYIFNYFFLFLAAFIVVFSIFFRKALISN